MEGGNSAKSNTPSPVNITISFENSKHAITFASNDTADNVKGLIAATIGLPIESIGGLKDPSKQMHFTTSPVVIPATGSFEVISIPSLATTASASTATLATSTANGEKRKKTPKVKRPNSPSWDEGAPSSDESSPPSKKSRSHKTPIGTVPKETAPPPPKKKRDISHLSPALKECYNSLMHLRKHHYAWIFNQPVDLKQYTDYLNYVSQPMDFGTVLQKLEEGKYPTPDHFAADIKLIFDNAIVYNSTKSEVGLMASALQSSFEKRFIQLQREGKVPPSNVIPMGSESTAQTPENPAPPKVKKEEDTREMTSDEKRALSMAINELTANQLGDLIQIIHQRIPSLVANQPDEIEIDLELLDNSTLRFLEKYVKKCIAKQKKAQEDNGQKMETS